MPVRYEEGKTPQGRRLLRMFVHGTCDLADAETLGVYLQEGGSYHHERVIVFVAPGTEYTPESRKYFPTLDGKHQAMATVVSSAIVRAAINLMMRLAGKSRNFRMFTDEAAALAWLDTV